MATKEIHPVIVCICLIAILVGTTHVLPVNAADDDCVNYLDAIQFFEPFAAFSTLATVAGVPREVSQLVSSPPDDLLSFPTAGVPGYTMLIPTNDAVQELLNKIPPYSCDESSLELEGYIGKILSYNILTEKNYGIPGFGLGGNQYKLFKTAFNKLPLKIEKSKDAQGKTSYVAVSKNGSGTITKPVDADGKTLPDNICIKVGDAYMPVNIFAVDQLLLPFEVKSSCGDNFDDCYQAFYDAGYSDISKSPYLYNKKVKWA